METKARSSRTSVLMGLFLVGLVLALFAARTNTAAYLSWFAPALAAAGVLVTLSAVSRGWLRFVLGALPVGFSLYLSLATIRATVAVFSPLQLRFRVSIWLENPNLLGAALVLAAIGSATIVKNDWVKFALIGLALIAVIATGSRTALVALLVASLINVVLSGIEAPIFAKWFVTATIVCITVGVFLLLWLLPPNSSRNLIIASDDLTHPRWSTHYAQEISVERLAVPGPFTGGAVHHIVARSDPGQTHGLVIHQTHGVAPEGYQFVASIYVRADTPQKVVISSNYTASVCSVDTKWTRCIAPPAVGNGHGSIQLQLRTLTPGAEIDIHVWGPQIEEGTEPTIVDHKHATLASELRDSRLLSRLNLRRVLEDGDSDRLEAMRIAWQAFRAHPWTGVGYGRIASWHSQATTGVGTERPRPFTHSHNLALQHLAENGILGLLAFLVPFTGTIVLAFVSSGTRTLPLVSAVIILNTTDFTFYNFGSFYVYWLCLGLLIVGSKTGQPDIGGGTVEQGSVAPKTSARQFMGQRR